MICIFTIRLANLKNKTSVLLFSRESHFLSLSLSLTHTLSLSLYIYIYIRTYIYVYIYTHIYAIYIYIYIYIVTSVTCLDDILDILVFFVPDTSS